MSNTLFSLTKLAAAMPTIELGDGEEHQIRPMNAVQSAKAREIYREVAKQNRAAKKTAADEDDINLELVSEDVLRELAELAASCVPTAPDAVRGLTPDLQAAIVRTAAMKIDELMEIFGKNGGRAATTSPPSPSNRRTPKRPSSSPSPAPPDGASVPLR